MPAGPVSRAARVSWGTSRNTTSAVQGRSRTASGLSPREDAAPHARAATLGNPPAQGIEGKSESLDSARGTGGGSGSILSVGSGTVEDADVETAAEEGSEPDSSVGVFSEGSPHRVHVTDQELTALAGRMRDAVEVKDR